MRGRLSAASAAVVMLGCASAASAADLSPLLTKAPPAAPSGPSTCSDIPGFFLTDCQLSWAGIRFYGTIDIGYGYQTHGSPWDKYYAQGVNYLVGKASRKPMWLQSPNGLSQSNIGLQIKEQIAPGWAFIAQLETAFDPYSMELANGPKSLAENAGRTAAFQTTNGDSANAGQFYNSQGWLGLASDKYGTLTVFRQASLMADGVKNYDPMGGSYAFSVIGFQGWTSGGGDSENNKYSTAVKYRYSFGDYFHIGALAQFGGYDLNNGAKEAYEGQIGGDYHVGPGLLSLDAIGGYHKGAVNLGVGSSAATPVTATISDNTNVMLLAKYTIDKLKLFAGYEWIQFAPPSDLVAFNDVGGQFIAAPTAFSGGRDKILQVAWAGAKYSITDALDVTAAYYHYDQNRYAVSSVDCTVASSNGGCAGTMDAVSAMIDWRFAPKWDTYIGTMFSQDNGGLQNGFQVRNNVATTGGIRFRW